MLTRENMVLVTIALCVFATIYLFKEMKDVKSSLNKPPQILRVPVPMQMEERRERTREPVVKKVEVAEDEEDEEDEEE